jgi:hypothetical protein
MTCAPYTRWIASAALALISYNTYATNVVDPWVVTPSGDFVLYGKLGESLWRSGNAGQTAAQAFLQGDGNLVIYGPTSAVWASNTAGQ